MSHIKRQQRRRTRISQWASMSISVLNGVFGDYLHYRKNELAIKMIFTRNGEPLMLNTESLKQAHPEATNKICILVHGLCCNERTWLFSSTMERGEECSYGTLLQKELGYTPFYLRYNTGLAIARNGRKLTSLLSELFAVYPAPVEEIVLIGHSMGGLVIRSACAYGVAREAEWVQKVKRVFYLGTPFEGADLEKLTNFAATALKAVPANPIAHVIAETLDRRSRGIKDLRYGGPLIKETDAATNLQDVADIDEIPWLINARHYLIAGALTEDAGHAITKLFGDVLVKLPRADKFTFATEGALPPYGDIRIFPKVYHLGLPHDLNVYRQIKKWCTND